MSHNVDGDVDVYEMHNAFEQFAIFIAKTSFIVFLSRTKPCYLSSFIYLVMKV